MLAQKRYRSIRSAFDNGCRQIFVLLVERLSRNFDFSDGDAAISM